MSIFTKKQLFDLEFKYIEYHNLFIKHENENWYWSKSNWTILSAMPNKLSEEFIEEFKDFLNWHNICQYQHLSEEFMERNFDYLDFEIIQTYQKLSEKFIIKFIDKINWKIISKYQDLSEEFIYKFKNKVEWSYIIIYQHISNEFFNQLVNEGITKFNKPATEIVSLAKSLRDDVKNNATL